jgi:hypothetical protein
MPALLLALALAAQDSPESVAKIQAALAKPPSRLTIPDIKPDFQVHIEERRPLQDLFLVPPWALDPHGWQPDHLPMKSAFGTPMVAFDLLALFRHGPLPAYIPQAPNEETERAIAAYCAAQPNDGTRILICER